MRLSDYYAPFGVSKRMRKIAYCNNNVIPILKMKNIDWDMNVDRIIFGGRRFSMKDIENGEAVAYAMSLRRGQSTLDEY